MKSRTSFFDKALLRKDITRFAPVWILYLIGGLMVGLGVVSGYHRDYYAASAVADTMGPLTMMNMIYALIVALCLFGDLFNTRMCYAIHALPLRREMIYATHVLAGLMFSVVPNLVFALVVMTQLGSFWYVALLWVLIMFLQYLFFFALAAVCALSTGSRFAMGAVYFLINFLSEIIRWFITTFYEPMLYGVYIRTDIFDWFCPVVWGSQQDELISFHQDKQQIYYDYIEVSAVKRFGGLTGQWWYFVILAGLGLALLGLGIWLYRKRKLESAGDFLAFRPMMLPCSVIFTLSVAAVFQMILGEILDMEILALIVGFLVGCFGTEMFLRRTVKVFDKRTCIKCALIGGAFALSLILTMIDPLGLTRWTPKPEKVASVTLTDYYNYNVWETRYEDRYAGLEVTDPEEIAQLVQIHETLADAEDPYDYGVYGDVGSVNLTYRLTDGRTVVRRYRYYTNSSVGDKLDRFFSKPQFILRYEDWDEFLKSLEYVVVEDMSGSRGSEEFKGKKARALMEAVKKDCENGDIHPEGKYVEALYALNVSTEDDWLSFYIGYQAEDTVEWIRENMEQVDGKLHEPTDQDILAGVVS
ncbi:MAG: hypothetical protein IIV61_00695 [Oscillospiraceae bacterium]|nr:hypothetical protein [Oscillospiraceae bacterium]